MIRISSFLSAALAFLALSIAPTPASAALEGVRDCGDVASHSWAHVLEGSPTDLIYLGHDWFVFAVVGLKPSCEFARKWAKIGVREAVGPIDKIYDHPLKRKNRPPGWICYVESSPSVVQTTGGLLSCLRFKKGKLIGSFSAGPDFSKQEGPV